MTLETVRKLANRLQKRTAADCDRHCAHITGIRLCAVCDAFLYLMAQKL